MLATAALDVTILLVAYALGCINAGYYLVLAATGRDVRSQGSGATGATNVGRMLGKRGFAVTFVADAAKGALAIGLAEACDLRSGWVWATAIAVVLGHVFPAQLGWRGGKGVSTWIGAVAVLDPFLVLITFLLACAARPWSSTATIAGLAALCATPVMVGSLQRDSAAVLGTASLLAVLLFAHRANIRAVLTGRPYP